MGRQAFRDMIHEVRKDRERAVKAHQTKLRHDKARKKRQSARKAHTVT